MPKKPFLIDPSLYDINHVIASIEDIRQYNRQRFEMEQLSAIVYESYDEKMSVGYKDVTDKEFWVRGHMPGFPLMPGVILCEAAAQLASYFTGKYDMFNGAVMGFAGLEDIKFRGMVKPGDRLVVQIKMLKWRQFLITSSFMEMVGDEIVCEGVIKGFPIKDLPT